MCNKIKFYFKITFRHTNPKAQNVHITLQRTNRDKR